VSSRSPAHVHVQGDVVYPTYLRQFIAYLLRLVGVGVRFVRHLGSLGVRSSGYELENIDYM
jgi:hypothetical protein